MPTGQRKAYFKNCSRRYFPSLILGIASALIGMRAGSDIEIVVYFCSMHVVYSTCQRVVSSLSLFFLKCLTFSLLNSNGILVHCVIANCNSDSTEVSAADRVYFRFSTHPLAPQGSCAKEWLGHSIQTARILEARTEVGLWFGGKFEYIRIFSHLDRKMF